MVRRLPNSSVDHYPDTLHLNLHETHFSYIQDVSMYCHSYRCRKCGDSLWKYAYTLRRHERSCTGCVRRVYPGGLYHSTPSVFERLDDENIRVPEWLRYYPYRATFEFECWFDTAQLPSDSDKVHWVARHAPLSNGHEQVECLVTDGDANKLVSDMMDILRVMSDAEYEKSKTLMCWTNSQKHKRTGANGSTLLDHPRVMTQHDHPRMMTQHDHPRMMTQHDHPRMVMMPMTRNLDHRPIHTKR